MHDILKICNNIYYIINKADFKLHRIIYTSQNKIDWDVQSAFKLTNYYTEVEEHMVFCYLRMFVQSGALKLCTYCFDKEASGTKDMELCLNLNPEKSSLYLHMSFGIDGINAVEIVSPDALQGDSLIPVTAKDFMEYHSHMANDQQGYYWCGEITIYTDWIEEVFDTLLGEKSILSLNLYKIFEDSKDYASLFPANINDKLKQADFMREFVVLKY